MTPEFWGNICLQKEATQEEIRGLPGQIKSDLRSKAEVVAARAMRSVLLSPPVPV
jgi:hypothetical protein